MTERPNDLTGDDPSGLSVLVSGAGFAGLAMCFWLTRLGYRVTLVEAAGALRRGGTPVDIKGETVGILSRMGLLQAVRAKALPPRAFSFKDADDATLGTFGTETERGGDAPEEYEIHRDDLLEILAGAVGRSVEWRFGQSISALDQGASAVSVTFADGTSRDYALVFGCDGNRSTTRRLAFGDVEGAAYFMGGYFYLRVVPETGLLPTNTSEVFSTPGRTVMLNGYEDRTDIALAFRTDGEIDYDYRDRAQQRRLIHNHFDGVGWKVPALLAHVDASDDFYFDAASQIRMPSWSKGRVVLVGDAGYCVSPVAGMGGSMAIIGAGRLADALARHPNYHQAAFGEYERKLRPFVEEVQQEAATQGMALVFPADEAELAERDRQLRDGVIQRRKPADPAA